MKVYIFYMTGGSYERSFDLKVIESKYTSQLRDAETWINEQIAAHPLGEFTVLHVIEGTERKIETAEYVKRIEIKGDVK